MLTVMERVRAILVNIKEYSWDVHPTFKLEKEDADALLEYLKNDENFKGVYMKNE